MRVVCGWCGSVLGFKTPLDDSRTSHGLCPACEAAIEDSPRMLDNEIKDLTLKAHASTIVPRPPESDKPKGDTRP